MQKSGRNYALKATPRRSVNFGKITQNCQCMHKIVSKIRYFDRALWKTLNKQDHEKQKEPETNDQSLIRL